MALTDKQKKKIEEEEKYRVKVSSPEKDIDNTQKHGVPVLLSFFVPGLGQIVKGQVGRGILIFIGVVVGLVLLVVPGVIIWIWQLVDAYNN